MNNVTVTNGSLVEACQVLAHQSMKALGDLANRYLPGRKPDMSYVEAAFARVQESLPSEDTFNLIKNWPSHRGLVIDKYSNYPTLANGPRSGLYGLFRVLQHDILSIEKSELDFADYVTPALAQVYGNSSFNAYVNTTHVALVKALRRYMRHHAKQVDWTLMKAFENMGIKGWYEKDTDRLYFEVENRRFHV